MDDATAVKGLESVADYAIRMVGSGIEMFGVLIIVAGIAWSTPICISDGPCGFILALVCLALSLVVASVMFTPQAVGAGMNSGESWFVGPKDLGHPFQS